MTKSIFAQNEFYHLYNRGVEKRIIFQDQSDYWRFSMLLFSCNTALPIHTKDISQPFLQEKTDPLVAIGAYCLMPNHFHLLVTPLQENGVSKFMQKLMTGYTMYFNKKYDRSGGLFQGRYKSQHADNDRYLKYLFSYIHLNPIRSQLTKNSQGLLKRLSTYKFSSHLDYLNPNETREQSVILTKKAFPLYFSSQKNYKVELLDWIHYPEVEPREG